MYNFNLSAVPSRSAKPRTKGITMVMDKGLSATEAANLAEAGCPYIDIIKLGFGSALVTPNLEKKLDIYKQNNIPVYFGGTMFEAFVYREKFEDYMRLLDKYKIKHAEVSDGSITLNHDLKCEYISRLAKNYTVVSEVGSKEEGILIHPNMWIKMMLTELQAGSWKVIAEARESGNVGIYRPNGKAHVVLINKIVNKVKEENIIWEAPQKAQQAYFVKLFGAEVNLGNIAPNEIIALETLRIGLRSDTFFQFVDKK